MEKAGRARNAPGPDRPAAQERRVGGTRPTAGREQETQSRHRETRVPQRETGRRARQDQNRAGHRGKSIRAASGHLKQRGFRHELNQVLDTYFPALEQSAGTVKACAVFGKSRVTVHRRRHPRPPVQGPRRPFHHPAELSDAEREQVLAVLDSPRFADKSPGQVWAILLDEGVYLCSQATMYRLLRERGQSGERRAQAVRPPTSKPELEADRPNLVWSWDITKLKGPVRGVYYLLYVIIDIFSRKVIHWEISPTENGTLAKEFIQNAIAANGAVAPRSIHADRGTSMTSNTVTGLLALLGIDQSHSRPHVSNDNPYSEAEFKTLKYCPAFPGRFGSIEDANVFCGQFFRYYNHEHRHSGIAMHTPASVHDGTAVHIQARRIATLHAAFQAHPERFRGRRPYPPALPTKVWINQPPTASETDTSPQSTRVA
ncbi:IS3 family transposase [Nonomuraea sp. NPDC004580]|uniref:IS3 family transposase n=1 Tax=Nonomuraea sp. NPDC004580 TaxID=3154552 RepID=UPI0033BA64A4